MKSAYQESWVYNLAVIKEAKRWFKHHLITKEQFTAIGEAYAVSFYHPNFVIRIVLFVATLLALSGVTGLFFLVLGVSSEKGISVGSILYGIVSFLFLEKVFIKKNHYKSGVTEALLYCACGFTIGGILGLDFSPHLIFVVCLLVFSFAAIRYLDLLTSVAAVLSLGGFLFFECFSMDGIFKQIIPFVFIIVFTGVYLWVKRLKTRNELKLWRNNMLIAESLSLLLIYAGGNYLVVRELSISMMDMEIGPGEDIPFAFIFYALTVLIPVLYLYVGIRNKDVVLLRVSLLVVAFSAFTFKYYFSLGHPEITLTLAGLALLGISISLLNYLKVMRSGFTREDLLGEKWGNMNVEAFIVSQTVGGNQVIKSEEGFKGGGGEFGGGGASGDF